MGKNFIKMIVTAFIFCFMLTPLTLAATAQYTYDKLNRLTQVQYDDGTIIQYSYDAVGNRLIQQVTAFTPPPQAPASGQTSGSVSNAPLIRNSTTPTRRVP